MRSLKLPSRGRAGMVPAAAAVLLVACASPAPNGAGGGQSPSVALTATSGPSVASAEPTSAATGSAAHSAEPSGQAALSSDPLHGLRLVDVRTGQEFQLGELAAEQPVLLETMAIWCSNCRAQQHNVVAAHALAEFHSVSLDVEPGELPEDLADYAERECFDWRFAMADASLLGQLRDRFGTAVAVPPSMPKILFGTDGSVELVGLGELLSPEQIAAAVNR